LSVIVLFKVSFKALSTSNVNVFFIVKSILRGVDLSERDAVDLLLPSGEDFGILSNAKRREGDLVAFSDDSVLSYNTKTKLGKIELKLKLVLNIICL
jgi:hypothetical protein